jgi:hypothetical protein
MHCRGEMKPGSTQALVEALEEKAEALTAVG